MSLDPQAQDAEALTQEQARHVFLRQPWGDDDQVPTPLPPHFSVLHQLNSRSMVDVEVVNVRADGTLVVFYPGALSGRSGAVGGEPYNCVDRDAAGAVLEGDILRATITRSHLTERSGAPTGDPSFDESVHCVDAGRTVEDLFYDLRPPPRMLLKTTRSSPKDVEPIVKLLFQRGVVRLRGDGCDAQLVLSKPRASDAGR